MYLVHEVLRVLDSVGLDRHEVPPYTTLHLRPESSYTAAGCLILHCHGVNVSVFAPPALPDRVTEENYKGCQKKKHPTQTDR